MKLWEIGALIVFASSALAGGAMLVKVAVIIAKELPELIRDRQWSLLFALAALSLIIAGAVIVLVGIATEGGA